MDSELEKLKKLVDTQAKNLQIYEKHYKLLQKEVEKLKEELLKYRGY